MEVRDKKILVQSVSAVLIIVVLFNVYSGITVSKIGIPGLIDIEFNSGDEPAGSSGTVRQDSNDGREAEDPSGVYNPEELNSPGDGYTYDTPQNVGQINRSPEPPALLIDVNGLWYGADGAEYEITQNGNVVYFIEYGLYGATANGSGTYQNSTLTFDYETIFGTVGTATLNLSPNGGILSGSATDMVSGTITELYLTRY